MKSHWASDREIEAKVKRYKELGYDTDPKYRLASPGLVCQLWAQVRDLRKELEATR